MPFLLLGSLGFAEHIAEALGPKRTLLGVMDHNPERVGQPFREWTIEPLTLAQHHTEVPIIIGTLDCAGAIADLARLGIGPERIATEVFWEPFLLQIEPTARCNLSCHYCSREQLPESRKSHDLDFATFRAWLEPLRAVRRIHLQGLGEPLLNRDLSAMIGYCIDRGISVSLTTNGMVSFRHLAAEALFALDKLVISLDQANEQGQFIGRTGGTQGKLNQYLDYFQGARPAWSKTRLTFNYVVCGGDAAGIDQAVDYAQQWRPNELHLHLAENWFIAAQPGYGAGAALAREAATLEPQLLTRFAVLHRQLANSGVGLTYTGSESRLGRCSWPTAGCFVSSDGFVTPCCIRMDPECFHFGRIGVDGDLRDLWFAERYQHFRHRFFRGQGSGVCDHCPQ